MTRLATSWLVYRLTHSALLLGLVSFAGLIVSFVLGPVAGVWVERLNRRKLLIATQAAAALQSLVMAALTLTGHIALWEIIVLAVLQGVVNAMDMPARQAFLMQMVEDRNDLSNAIAINSAMVNGARLIGPALAGLVIGSLGEGWCFLIDGVSYFAVIASLLAMRLKAAGKSVKTGGMIDGIREGWSYVTRFRPIRAILLLVALVSLMGYPYMVLLPVFAGDVLHGGPHTLAWLTAASGAGALVAALSLVARKSVLGLMRLLCVAAGLLGGALVLFGLSQALWLSLALMVLAGFGLIQVAAISNTLIQIAVPEDKRARAMSYYMMAFFGTAPFGSLLAGASAHLIGAPATIIATGIFCLAGAFSFAVKLPEIERIMGPVYRQMGLMPTNEKDLLYAEQKTEAETLL